MKWEINLGLQLERIFLDTPNQEMRCHRERVAMPSSVIFMVQEMNLAAFEQPWSMIVRTVLKLFNSGKSMIRSMAITWKGPW